MNLLNGTHILKISALSLALAATQLSAAAFAAEGGHSGGGGVGVECREEGGSLSLVTLDYYEAVNRGIKIPVDRNSKSDVVRFISDRVMAYDGTYEKMKDPVRETAAYIQRYKMQLTEFIDGESTTWDDSWHRGSMSLFPARTEISFSNSPNNLTNDYGRYQLEPNCRLKQIAVFHAARKPVLKIDLSLFNRLDWLNRAILYLHEVSYAEYRPVPENLGRDSIMQYMKSEPDLTSTYSRLFVGELLSGTLKPSVFGSYPQDSHFCADEILPVDYSRLQSRQGTMGIGLMHVTSIQHGVRVDIRRIGDVLGMKLNFEINADFPNLTQDSFLSGSPDFEDSARIFMGGVFKDTGLVLNLKKTNGRMSYWLSRGRKKIKIGGIDDYLRYMRCGQTSFDANNRAYDGLRDYIRSW